jgi:hypothetical protein
MQETIPPEALLAGHPGDLRQIAERLRTVVLATVPGVVERVRPGWGLIGYDLMIGRRLVYFCWVWPESVHVHLGFQRGVLMDDPGRRLQGRGTTKQVRWLTFRPGDPIDPRVLAPLILEAARIAGLSRAEQMAIALDRETDGR